MKLISNNKYILNIILFLTILMWVLVSIPSGKDTSESIYLEPVNSSLTQNECMGFNNSFNKLENLENLPFDLEFLHVLKANENPAIFSWGECFVFLNGNTKYILSDVELEILNEEINS